MSWKDWLFWRKHCKICGETYKTGGATIMLKCEDGTSKLKICPTCSGLLEGQRQNLLNMDIKLDDKNK